MTNDELRRRVKRLATKVEHVARMTRAELCHMAVGRDRLMTNYLRNDGHNSCYLDSILVALLAAQRNCNSWVHKHVWRSKPDEIWAQNPELAEQAMRIRDELKLIMFPLDVIDARRNASALRRMILTVYTAPKSSGSRRGQNGSRRKTTRLTYFLPCTVSFRYLTMRTPSSVRTSSACPSLRIRSTCSP